MTGMIPWEQPHPEEEPKPEKKLYRYIRYHSWSGWKVLMSEFFVISETNKGYWITPNKDSIVKIFVLAGSGKRFAYDTKEAALENFNRRTKRCILLLEAQLRAAKECLKESESLINNKHENNT